MSIQIMVVKPRSLSAKDKEKLTKAGNMVIEHPSPGDIVYKAPEEHLPYVFTNCASCGDRIYMLRERLTALRANKKTFWCSQGHGQNFT